MTHREVLQAMHTEFPKRTKEIERDIADPRRKELRIATSKKTYVNKCLEVGTGYVKTINSLDLLLDSEDEGAMDTSESATPASLWTDTK